MFSVNLDVFLKTINSYAIRIIYTNNNDVSNLMSCFSVERHPILYASFKAQLTYKWINNAFYCINKHHELNIFY